MYMYDLPVIEGQYEGGVRKKYMYMYDLPVIEVASFVRDGLFYNHHLVIAVLFATRAAGKRRMNVNTYVVT